ncbi:hypothetical protein GD1_20 [Paraglaciecola Antarctic GD virus 1]|nr:hypothetical protein GD1_20 [Paraglaciecola Antarctic GD virus 1]
MGKFKGIATSDVEHALYVLQALSTTDGADLENVELCVSDDLDPEGAARYDMPAIANLLQTTINSLVQEIAQLTGRNDELASIAEERSTFILNGVECGYIRLPEKGDSALDVYERCNMIEPKLPKMLPKFIMDDLSHLELANEMFIYGQGSPSLQDMLDGARLPIHYLTAGKERIRWLATALENSQIDNASLRKELSLSQSKVMKLLNDKLDLAMVK